LTGFALADLDGRLVEAHRAEVALPPASVAKVFTALYALEALGPGYRFRTTLRAAGPIEAGTLRGELALVGGGDPLLDTDALGDLARALAAAGLRRVEGGFHVAGDALPAIAEVAGAQPEDAGYNPTISGLNLNFNRVLLEWSPGTAGPELRFSAPGVRHAAPVAGIEAELAEGGPARHRREPGREVWILPRKRVHGTGSEWLPVRAPLAYAGEAFRGLAAQAGIALPPPTPGPAAGAVLALHDSLPLERMMRDMLYYSTNLTAEVAGLRAAQAQGIAPATLADSAAAMTRWARRRLGLSQAVFANHSGLGDASRLPAREMAAALCRAAERLPELLRTRPILDAERRPIEIGGVGVLAKTGTLDFVSALAGYMTGRRRLAFAIFAADPELRARVRPEEREAPPGSAAWAGRARAQEQALLRRWARLYAA
jgi:D-alanyl-D-alanine carboxypeptidase/D-alanyl-D-alanine-endopeptidase (penicillin-binding protein 4)